MLNEGDILITLDYEDDAERKRAEYFLKENAEAEAQKLNGLVRVLSGDQEQVEQTIQGLSGKVDSENLSYGAIDKSQISSKKSEYGQLNFEFDASADRADWALDYIENRGFDRGRSPEVVGDNKWEIIDNELGPVLMSYDFSNLDEGELSFELFGEQGVTDAYAPAVEHELEASIQAELDSVEVNQTERSASELGF